MNLFIDVLIGRQRTEHMKSFLNPDLQPTLLIAMALAKFVVMIF